ncbi:hypothetical protein E8E12_002264 [Didymella heteroderae]|uniref:Uncharacterized protein n=1 Tax=Didymella heteroderae TaxID=1769908 RepID=A0A9P4WIQ7_9PLEO|nr:hypothetical protein E8E12_002264 [Didymella heteroderae]
MTAEQLDEFDMLSQDFPGSMEWPFDVNIPPQHSPTYHPPILGGSTQQGHSYMPQQGRMSTSQLDQLCEPQQQQAAPSDRPMYNPNGFAPLQQAPHTFGGYDQGRFPINYTSYGNISLHAPYSFHNWGDLYGNLAFPNGNNNYGSAQTGQWLPVTHSGGMESGPLRSAGTTSAAPQPSRLNPEAKKFKYGRTATMDAQYQPPPNRVKRD